MRRLCQRDLFSALTGHLFFPGGQMDFLLLKAQFQQVAKKDRVLFLIASDRSSLEWASSSHLSWCEHHADVCSSLLFHRF